MNLPMTVLHLQLTTGSTRLMEKSSENKYKAPWEIDVYSSWAEHRHGEWGITPEVWIDRNKAALYAGAGDIASLHLVNGYELIYITSLDDINRSSVGLGILKDTIVMEVTHTMKETGLDNIHPRSRREDVRGPWWKFW